MPVPPQWRNNTTWKTCKKKVSPVRDSRSGETLPALGYTKSNFPFSKLVNCAVLVEKFGFFYGCIFYYTCYLFGRFLASSLNSFKKPGTSGYLNIVFFGAISAQVGKQIKGLFAYLRV